MTQLTVPVFTRLDRMTKALDHADMTMQDMADFLGVKRETISRWLNGRSAPSKGMVRAWAMRTGVPFEWVETGQAPTERSEPGEVVRHQGLEPRTRWFTTRPAA